MQPSSFTPLHFKLNSTCEEYCTVTGYMLIPCMHVRTPLMSLLYICPSFYCELYLLNVKKYSFNKK
jgi:hypothetical protein